jgi:hypothetical protein
MITVKQILTYFPNKSDDPALFTSQLNIVYTMYIRPLLGKDFYNQLKTQYDSDTLSTDNDTFLREYLQPIIAHYTMFLTMPYRRAEPTANGVMQQLPELSVTPSEAQVGLSSKTMISTAELLVKVAKDYLRDNASLYPLYKCSEDISGGVGVFLGGYSNSQVFLDKNR